MKNLRMGLPRFERGTSRLSAKGHESPELYIYIEEAAFRPHAPGGSINETPASSPAPRTQRVPAMGIRGTLGGVR